MHKQPRIYESLLRLYPAAYREQYGGQMVQTLQDMLDDAASRRQRTGVWLRVAMDVPISVARAQLSYTGDSMRTETPLYMKQAGLAVAGLIAPFFLIVIINGLDRSMYGRELNDTWLWSKPALMTWALVLPGLAMLFATVSYARFASAKSDVHWLRRALNVRLSWPVVLPGIVALGILLLVALHDSAHCLVGNPVRIAHNPHQTLQCVSRGFLGGE